MIFDKLYNTEKLLLASAHSPPFYFNNLSM